MKSLHIHVVTGLDFKDFILGVHRWNIEYFALESMDSEAQFLRVPLKILLSGHQDPP